MATQQQPFIKFLLLNSASSYEEDFSSKRGETRQWIKHREDLEFFTNFIQELKLEDNEGLKEISRMSHCYIKQILEQTQELRIPMCFSHW